MFNNGINSFNVPAQLKKIDNQPKAEEKKEEKPAEKLEVQKQQVGPHKVSSKEVLAFMEKNAVVNAPKTQAPENVAPKQNAEKTEVDRTVEEYVDKNGLIVRTTTIIYDDGSKSVITQKITTQGFNTLIESLCFSQQVEEYDNEGNLISKNNVLPYPFDMGDGATVKIDGRQYSVSLTQDENGKFIGILDDGCYRYEVKFDENYRMVSVERTYKSNSTQNYHACSMFDENGLEIVSSHGGRCLPGHTKFPADPEKIEENFYKLIEKFNLPKELLNLDIYNEDSGFLYFTGGFLNNLDFSMRYNNGVLEVEIGNVEYRITEDESVIEIRDREFDANGEYIKTNIFIQKYDEQGRITKEEKTETDADGNVTTTTTEYSYSLLGMNKTTTVVNEDGSKAVTKEKQDRSGNVTSKVTYYYDKDGNLVDTVVEVEDKTSKLKIDPNKFDSKTIVGELKINRVPIGNLKNISFE